MNAQHKRILHVFRSPIGGLFRHVIDLAREQASRGHDVGLFFDSSTQNARTPAILEEITPHLRLGIVRVPMRRNPGFGDIAAIRALRRLQNKVKADVLHGHGSKGGAYVRALAGPGRLGAVRAYTPHGGSFHFKAGDLRHHLYMTAERLLARRTDVFLFESGYVAKCFEETIGTPQGTWRIVHNGLHPHEFEPLDYSGERFDLLYIGELLFAKGIDTLIEALALLRDRHERRLSLLVVGSGPDAEALAALARERSLDRQVTFEPPQPIRNVLARSDLMVMPSRAESLPYVVLEAAAAGHPLVATDVGGIPEILAPVREELLQPGDPVRLSDALLARLLEGEEAREARNAAILQHLRSGFSVAHMTDAVLEGYEAATSPVEAAQVSLSLR